MDYNHLTVRTLTRTIYNTRGIMLKQGMSFLIRKDSTKIVDPKIEKCLIYLDNGGIDLEDFDQHIVNKKLMYDNSI
jgi:hypothetical protein